MTLLFFMITVSLTSITPAKTARERDFIMPTVIKVTTPSPVSTNLKTLKSAARFQMLLADLEKIAQKSNSTALKDLFDCVRLCKIVSFYIFSVFYLIQTVTCVVIDFDTSASFCAMIKQAVEPAAPYYPHASPESSLHYDTELVDRVYMDEIDEWEQISKIS